MTTTVSNPAAETMSATKKKKRGFTLTEIAIVLGIVGLILGAIWVAAAAVYNNLRVSHANTEILQLTQGIRALYATQNTNSGMSDSTLITAGAVPKDMINAAGTGMTDPWPPGTTTTGVDSDNLGFTITMSLVPQAACINLITSVAGSNRDPSLFEAQTGGTINGVTGNPLTIAATPALAAAAVSNNIGGCTAATNTVTFGFGLH